MTLPLWPPEALSRAVIALGQAAGMELASAQPTPRSPGQGLEDWAATVGAQLGVDLAVVAVRVPEAATELRRVGPALLPVDGGYLAVLEGRGSQLRVLTPVGARRSLDVAQVAAQMCGPVWSRARGGLGPELSSTLAETLGPEARAALLRYMVRDSSVDGVILVRAGAGRFGPARRRSTLTAALGLLALHPGRAAALVCAWAALGRGVLSGRFEGGLVAAWIGLLLLFVALSLVSRWIQSTLVHHLGASLHQRMLQRVTRSGGASRRAPGEVLARVLETDAIDAVAVEGGLLATLAVVDLLVAGWILALTPGGGVQIALLLCWSALLVVGAGFQLRYRLRWSGERVERTRRLVEQLRGHRARIALGLGPESLAHEDVRLAHHYTQARSLDRVQRWTDALAGRGPLLAGVVVLLAHPGAGVGAVAVALAGLLYSADAFAALAAGVASLVDAFVAWRAARPLLELPAADAATSVAGIVPASAPLEVREVAVSRGGRVILPPVSRAIQPGERVLLSGPSGAGKSTLAEVLAGLASPDSGGVSCGGLDRTGLGAAAWARVVALAPQFNRNHVFNDTLAFNLLLGRRWPPRSADLQEAREICEALGLGALLDAMPAGLHEQLGESGWQLSHGERSRVFLARALLQGAQVVVLDGSLGALDPDTLRRVLSYLEGRPEAVVLIAQP